MVWFVASVFLYLRDVRNLSDICANYQMAAWSSGMILASGARGPGFNSQSSPLLLVAFSHPCAQTCAWPLDSRSCAINIYRSEATVRPRMGIQLARNPEQVCDTCRKSARSWVSHVGPAPGACVSEHAKASVSHSHGITLPF